MAERWGRFIAPLVLGLLALGVWEGLVQAFKIPPYLLPGPILIELFNNHPMFSGRVLALPDLHTIGACTGRMIALVSPHDKGNVLAKPFNWKRVLRHELVHIFNLEQTNFLVPHWFTEGLDTADLRDARTLLEDLAWEPPKVPRQLRLSPGARNGTRAYST